MTLDKFKRAEEILATIKQLEGRCAEFSDELKRCYDAKGDKDIRGAKKDPDKFRYVYTSTCCHPPYVVLLIDDWIKFIEKAREQTKDEIYKLNAEFNDL